ncbi:HepT-like ribonuclease domain-containing protein [Neorhizobium huautlense]|uniref:HepT-like ribonuclease domain-containing protein n=1 Tax=Neorhizobium huautlense TaxID=67774 RepID=UPI000CF8BD2E|nr:HepT-like ribonuclease domain-containing protein [Neorhizobium huautlense]
MSSERLQTHLDRMIFAGEKAVKYVRGMDGDGFRENEIIQDAVIANIMAIGECATKIMEQSPDFVVGHPEIPWRDIKNMPNRIAHQYFQLDIETVWRTVDQMIPQLLSQLQAARPSE